MKTRFTFRQLEYVVAVSQDGSISAAAARLNVSSPSISTAISQLESELGVQIFVRQHAQGLSLTPGGQRIFAKAKDILASASGLNDVANDISNLVRGPISIGCLVTMAPLMSAAIRRSFETAHPNTTMTLREANQEDLLAMLSRAEIDFAITYDLDIPDAINFEGLIKLPPCVIVGKAHPMAHRSSIALSEIADDPMVLLDLPLSRDYFLGIFSSLGLRAKVAERSTDLAVTRSLVANGFGYSLINFRPKTNFAPDGSELVFLPLEGDHRPMIVGLASAKSTHISQIMVAFEDHMQDMVKKGVLPGMAQ